LELAFGLLIVKINNLSFKIFKNYFKYNDLNFIASIGFLKDIIAQEKRLLVLYPVILFFSFFAWFILMNHNYIPLNENIN